MSSSCCGGNCGCGSSCKCGSGCGGCKMYPESAAGSTTCTTETRVLGVGPAQTGDVHGSEMAAAGTESGGCKCSPCKCNPCNCK